MFFSFSWKKMKNNLGPNFSYFISVQRELDTKQVAVYKLPKFTRNIHQKNLNKTSILS